MVRSVFILQGRGMWPNLKFESVLTILVMAIFDTLNTRMISSNSCQNTNLEIRSVVWLSSQDGESMCTKTR